MARIRILYGTLLLVAGIGLYALVVTRISVLILPHISLIEFPFYAIAGVLWVWPAAKVTAWMQDLPSDDG